MMQKGVTRKMEGVGRIKDQTKQKKDMYKTPFP